MLVHSEAPPYSFENESNLSSAELYRRVMKKYTKLEQLPETNYRASAAPHACFQAGSIILSGLRPGAADPDAMEKARKTGPAADRKRDV